jgi:hypothetical protein
MEFIFKDLSHDTVQRIHLLQAIRSQLERYKRKVAVLTVDAVGHAGEASQNGILCLSDIGTAQRAHHIMVGKRRVGLRHRKLNDYPDLTRTFSFLQQLVERERRRGAQCAPRQNSQ